MSTVDCSRYQGVLSVSLLQGWKAAGVTRVILKAGGGNSGRYEDSLWAANSANVRAAGLLLEAYWFNGTTDPAGDAQFLLGFLPGGIRVWADVESEGAMQHWSDDQADMFETAVVAGGHPSGTYMSASVTFQPWPKCSRRPLWVAGYGFSSTPAVGNWRAPVLWQYTSTGHLPGYAGDLDLDTDLPGLTDVSATPIIDTTSEEDTMQLNALRNWNGSIGIVDDAGLLNPLDSIGEWNSYLRIGIVKQQANGEYYVQQDDGTVWNALAAITARVHAQRAGDSAALAQATAALVIPAVLAGLQQAGGAPITQAQIEAASEVAIKAVLGQAAAAPVTTPAPAS